MEEVWIGNCIYWTILKFMTTLYRTPSHGLVFSVALLRNAATSLLLGSRPRRLATISHKYPTLLTAVLGLSRNGTFSS
jgi:hypothetical protein